MALDAVAELLGGAARFLGCTVFDGLIQVLLPGTGWLVLKPLYSRKDAPEWLCALVGLIVWIAIGAAAFVAYRYVQTPR